MVMEKIKGWKKSRIGLEFNFKNGEAHENCIIENGKYIVINSKFISTEGKIRKYSNNCNCNVDSNDILMVMSDLPNGKALSKCFFAEKSNTYTVNQRVCRLYNCHQDPRYMYYNINRNKYFLAFDNGVTQTNLRKDDIINCPIYFPESIKEQTAIAETLSDVDELILLLEKLIEKKKNIKTGAMQDLLSGIKRLPGYDDEWGTVTLESLCYLITKQTGFDYTAEIKPSLVTNYREGTIPFIQNKDFEGYHINYNTDFYIPYDVAIKYPKILLDDKCLLISISGKIGNVAIFDNEYMSFAGGAVGIAKLKDNSFADWCMLYLLSDNGQGQIFAHEKVGAQHNLTIEDVRNIEIEIPSKEERDSIVDILTDMDFDINQLQEKLDKYRQIKQGMMNELLTGKIRLL